MDTLIRDLKYGARFMIRAPGFALAAIVSLGLGIGANTAIFSLLEALLLRPMPVAQPERIVSVYTSDYSSTTYGGSSYPDYLDFRQRGATVADLAAYQVTTLSMNSDGDTEITFGEAVSGNYFALLGVGAVLGRVLVEDDDRDAASPAAVISHALWSRRFGADPAAIGRRVLFNGQPYTIVGVVSREYTGALRGLVADVWVPSWPWSRVGGRARDWTTNRGARGMMLIGRLRPNVTVPQAQAAFNLIAGQLYAAYPQQWRNLRNTGRTISIVSERDSRLHPDLFAPVAGFMALLIAVVGVVLLAACANVANLLLARGAARSREIAVRLALGSGRMQLIRQLLTENVLLSVAGGAFGILVASGIMRVLMAFRPPLPFAVGIDLRLDWPVLLFTLALSLLTGLVFGLAPALHAARRDLVAVLKADVAIGPGRSRLRGAFVVAQIACAMFLFVGAGLFVRSLLQARAIDVGFNPDHVIVAALSPSLHGYDQTRGRALFDQVLTAVSALPNIESASLASSVPLGIGGSRRGTTIEGYQPQPGEDTETAYNVVSPRYFETMGIALVRGRPFTDADGAGAPPVVIVNDAFARRYWPGADPIGKRLSANGSRGPFREVIGVARTGKYRTLGEEPRPFYYLPLWQAYEGQVTLHVKAAGDPALMLRSLRDAIRAIDATVPVHDLKTMHDQLLIALLPARLAGTLLGAFGLLALLLASVGIYGVMAYSVVQRTREIGVRRALGAQTGNLLRLVLGEGMRLAAIGFAIGLAAAAALTRFAASLLYGVTPTDPLTFAGALAVLTAAALVACYLPALRALSVDPVTALRYE